MITVPKTYDKGDMVTLGANFYNTTKQLTDPTAVVLKVIDPEENQTIHIPVHDSIGTYHYDLDTSLTDLTGIWKYRFEASGTVTGAEEGAFYLRWSDFS